VIKMPRSSSQLGAIGEGREYVAAARASGVGGVGSGGGGIGGSRAARRNLCGRSPPPWLFAGHPLDLLGQSTGANRLVLKSKAQTVDRSLLLLVSQIGLARGCQARCKAAGASGAWVERCHGRSTH